MRRSGAQRGVTTAHPFPFSVQKALGGTPGPFPSATFDRSFPRGSAREETQDFSAYCHTEATQSPFQGENLRPVGLTSLGVEGRVATALGGESDDSTQSFGSTRA